MSAAARKNTKGVWAKNVGAYLPKVTKPAFEKFGFPAASIITDWAAIAGPDIASFTIPEKLSWPPLQPGAGDEPGLSRRDQRAKSGATLVLRVEGPRALEVQFKTPQILDRINTFFGYRAITALRIVQAPLTSDKLPDLKPAKPPRPMPDTPIDEIEHEGLRAALAKMAHGVARR